MPSNELIDTLWNVNVFVTVCFLSLLIELIDTLWNVNRKKLLKRKKQKRELIDTLWNVNVSSGNEDTL